MLETAARRAAETAVRKGNFDQGAVSQVIPSSTAIQQLFLSVGTAGTAVRRPGTCICWGGSEGRNECTFPCGRCAHIHLLRVQRALKQTKSLKASEEVIAEGVWWLFVRVMMCPEITTCICAISFHYLNTHAFIDRRIRHIYPRQSHISEIFSWLFVFSFDTRISQFKVARRLMRQLRELEIQVEVCEQ